MLAKESKKSRRKDCPEIGAREVQASCHTKGSGAPHALLFVLVSESVLVAFYLITFCSCHHSSPSCLDVSPGYLDTSLLPILIAVERVRLC
jgi:hypothetical protein